VRPVHKEYTETIFEELTDDEKQRGYFQQNNASACISCNSVSALHELFEDRNITSGMWPGRSPDLRFCDFDLWGNVKGKMNKKASRTDEIPQNEIKNVTAPIWADELRRATQGCLRRNEASLRANCDHFEHFI
jgi:hypothetical protein